MVSGRPSHLGLLFSRSGFTLIEILISIFLVALLYMSMSIGIQDDNSSLLDKELDNIDRAVRYSVNESILNGGMARVRFLMDKVPAQYLVEIGPSDGFVLPEFPQVSQGGLSSSDRAKRDQMVKSIDSDFSRVDELKDGNFIIDERVRLVGIGKSHSQILITDYNPSLYVYPTGEKDDFMVIIATDEEVAALIVTPFAADTSRKYQRLNVEEVFDQDALFKEQDKVAKEMFDAWRLL